MKKTASHRLLHLVENRSSNLQLQYLDADTGKNIPAKLLRQNEYDYSITPVVDDKHWIHRVFELVPRTARSATDPDEKEQQTFLVIGNEAFTSTMSMVFCWTARDKKMSGPQVRHFVEEIEAMQLFIAGSLQVQSFIDHNLDRFSIVGYKTISSPHVMTVTLDDGIQNEVICKAELPCCLEVIIENRHPSVILDSPHIMSIGSKFIKGMSAMQAKLNGRISHMFNALPMEGCLGRGVRVSYALQYCNKDGTVIDNNNKSVHITWKADLEGTNKHNEAYSAYMHFTSGTEKYHDEESSETIYSRRGYNDSAPNSTVIETYVHGPVRCFVALILLSGNRATAASRLYILTTSSLDDIKKYTADLNRTTTRSGTIYGDPESDSDDENDN
ncbi:hypothetical protein BDF22DRAFT_172108 [Syncephalis plumigaleata]|nr:hypothetical protein BDF22DRAFT_172108 [Syncephalis plumigaleata]